MDQLKNICREHYISNFFRLSKQDLIDHIISSLNTLEQIQWLRDNELDIIKQEIKKAVYIIFNRSTEKLTNIEIDKDRNEIELTFENEFGATTNFVELKNLKIEDPQRDCDCRSGAEKGFCKHFWIAIMIAIQQNYIEERDWSLTELPPNFFRTIEKYPITEQGVELPK